MSHKNHYLIKLYSVSTSQTSFPPDPPHRKDGLVLSHHTRQTLQSTLWYCSQFLTVIFFVAMLPKHLAHCLFRFAPQPKSQANTQHSNKKTLHSNHLHRSAYASIKIGGSILKHNAVLCVRFAQPPIAYASIPPQWLSHKSPLC